MARPRKPTKVKKLQGTLRKHRIRDEWEPPVGAPPMPEHFGADARRQWRLVMPVLLQAGLITTTDASTLEAFCEAYQEWKDAARIIAKEGQLVEVPPYGQKAHPAVKILNDARAQCMSYAQRFGLDPASRSRIAAPPAKETKDETKDFLFAGGLKVIK